MDKKQAQQLIQQLFTQPFELESYRHFVRNLLNHYEERSGHYAGNYIPDAFKQHVNQYWRIGKYVDPDGNQLDLLVVEVKSLAKLERARSSLRNFAVNRLKQFEKEASLIAFYAQNDHGADWRFSFVKIEHEAYQDDKGKVKLKQELTPARRYSYLVGQHENSHTACRQLLPVLEMDYADPKVEEIEAAFSIEKITDEFFDQYKALFQKLAEHLKKQPWFKQASNEETDQAVSRFAKKLLGQIVFLYFLQKKGWLGAVKGKAWGEGSKRFLRERYQQTEQEGGNYYRDFLQYLFYEALAYKREEQDDPGYYERFHCRVPFLNGGLFEADYDWRQVNIEIPNSLFHNDEKTRAGDVGTGILDVFDRYNFTIKEDEPLDKEVAVDPEMLGKVFENMLEITERKSKGAFYTPREIVHYMCQESLIHYLDNRLNQKNSPPSQGGEPAKSGGGSCGQPGLFDFADKSTEQKINNLPYLKTLRKELRNNLTPAEASLWSLLQNKQLDGRKFRRQHSVANYILDFYCPAEQLAVELDGEIHNLALQAEYDRERDLFLQHTGIKVLRFENRLIFENPDGVLQTIRDEFGWNKKQPPHPSGTQLSPCQGGVHEVGGGSQTLPPHPAGTQLSPCQGGVHAVGGGSQTLPPRPSGTQLSPCQGGVHAVGGGSQTLPPRPSGTQLSPCQGGVHEVGGGSETKPPRPAGTPPSQGGEFGGRGGYDLKRHAIAESIYGVDIDASAIDIARLRLWLSLIVDEEDYGTIAALPNLDYKIVQGDSLVGFPENWRSTAADKIEELKKKFFTETDHDRKAELKTQIDDEIRKRMAGSKSSFGYQIDFDFRLMFSEVWHHKGGFDVVIGNPPYVQIQNFSGQQVQKDWEAQKYESFAKTGDIYCLFYEKGYRLLKDKGALAFITSNKWMRAAYGEKLRRFFLSKVEIEQLIDFGDSPIFSEATTYTNILLFEKGKQANSPIAWDLSSAYRKATSLERMLDENPAGAALFNEESFVIASAEMAAIKQRIEQVGTPLKEWDIAIYRGILTGFNEAFIIDGQKKDELIAADPKSAEIIKPILRGRDIKRYRVDFADLWLIATFPALNLNIDDYPAVRDYLKSFGRKLHQTGEVIGKDENGTLLKSRKKTGNKWFETQDQISYFKEFSKAKIVWLEMSPKPNFAYSINEDFVLNTSYILTGNNLKWLLAILNSEIMDCYFPMVATDVRGKTRRYIKQYVELLPILPRRESYAGFLEPLVDYAELAKSQDYKLQSAYFEQLIDGLVYELYFPDELKAAGKDIFRHLGELPPISSPPFQGGVPAAGGGGGSETKPPRPSGTQLSPCQGGVHEVGGGSETKPPRPSGTQLSPCQGGVHEVGGGSETKPPRPSGTPPSQGGEFEMSDEEKLAIIKQQFDRLYDPRHPVRNIIETLDSVEVVRTIREALKR
jgi:very-short-patch-repair endonuclease/type I restriction-modification system DNA methylase subunit